MAIVGPNTEEDSMETPHRGTARRGRPAFTLIEVIVVISIIALLVLLLLSGVFRAREASRRLECTNRLRQIGLALQNHQSVHSFYPPPLPFSTLHNGTYWAGSDGRSGYYDLLPFLERADLFNAMNIGILNQVSIGPEAVENATVGRARVDAFICPSDSFTSSFKSSPNSYRFNVGAAKQSDLLDTSRRGAFHAMRRSSPSDFTDGLSQTVGLSERLVGGQNESRFSRGRDYWCANVNSYLPNDSDDVTRDVCRSLKTSPPEFLSNLGESWMIGNATNLWYNHVAPPNDRFPDCSTTRKHESAVFLCTTCSIAARSLHAGGVNSIMMDGSIHFMKETINLRVWRGLGTRSGGEPVSQEW